MVGSQKLNSNIPAAVSAFTLIDWTSGQPLNGWRFQ
jgi:hypothetical protein